MSATRLCEPKRRVSQTPPAQTHARSHTHSLEATDWNRMVVSTWKSCNLFSLQTHYSNALKGVQVSAYVPGRIMWADSSVSTTLKHTKANLAITYFSTTLMPVISTFTLCHLIYCILVPGQPQAFSYSTQLAFSTRTAALCLRLVEKPPMLLGIALWLVVDARLEMVKFRF